MPIQSITPEQAMRIAVQHHEAGRLSEAEGLCRQVLAVQSEHSEALRLLGLIAHRRGQVEEAVALLRRAVAKDSRSTLAHFNLGNALRDQGKPDDAVSAYSRAIELDPRNAKACCNLGGVLWSQRKPDEAIDACAKSVAIDPHDADAFCNLGNALRDRGKSGEAVAAYQRAVQLDPSYAVAFNNLGNALRDQLRRDEAIAAYSRAIEIKPGFAQAHTHLAIVLTDEGKLDDAIAAYGKAIAIQPDYFNAHAGLARCLKDQGRLDEAIASFDRAMELKPQDPALHSNRIYTLYFHPDYDSAAILREQLAWDRRHGMPRDHWSPSRDPRRSVDQSPAPSARLRVGYVSPCFRAHVIGYNLLPLFREHDHQAVEVYCYSDVVRPDSVTEQFQSCADVWRNTVGLSHERLADIIREDRLDILVDLTMHLAHNRLPVFAQRPAPVQITFAGYPGGTGLSAIDYRLTDPHLDPPGETDRDYVEQSIRLPETFWCYDPPTMPTGTEPAPQVSPLPALAQGRITFGCLNNFCKINDPVLILWARVLRAVPSSRLILLAHPGSHRHRTLDRLEQEQIDPARVQFESPAQRLVYLKYYHSIDIGLDSFPYNGHTTSLDSYWMGVPVVTLVGKTVVGRAGLSQLTNLGLTDLIARNPDQYVQIVSGLATNLPRLAELRAGLRQRMLNSPLTDARRFARSIEAAYRGFDPR